MAFTPPPGAPAKTPDAPSRVSDNLTFSNAVDAFIAWLSVFTLWLTGFIAWINTFLSEIAATQSDVTAKSSSAATSATNASASAAAAALAANVARWVAGSNYAQQGIVVWSPTDFQNYRCINPGVSIIDPAQDLINWRVVNYVPPWKLASGAYVASPGDKLMFNTSAAPGSIQLPANPVSGVTRIDVKDYANTFSSNTLIVLRNGSNIEGLAQDMTVTQSGRSFTLTYIDQTMGWKAI